MKILVVDDDKAIQKILVFNLNVEGFTVFQANDGKEAVEMMELESPDLVVLDVMMPEMNGYEVLEYMSKREHLSSIPVIMLSARGQEVDIEKGYKAGATRYISKPFSPDRLISEIRSILS